MIHWFIITFLKRLNRLEMKRSKLNLDLKSLYDQKSQSMILNDARTNGTFEQNQTVAVVPSVFNQEVINVNVSFEIPS